MFLSLPPLKTCVGADASLLRARVGVDTSSNKPLVDSTPILVGAGVAGIVGYLAWGPFGLLLAPVGGMLGLIFSGQSPSGGNPPFSGTSSSFLGGYTPVPPIFVYGDIPLGPDTSQFGEPVWKDATGTCFLYSPSGQGGPTGDQTFTVVDCEIARKIENGPGKPIAIPIPPF